MSVSRTSSRLPDSVARAVSQVFLIVKSTLKNILNITATCLRCDDINPVDKTIKKSSQKSYKKMREYAKCRLLMRMLTIKMAKCIVNLFSFEIGICLTAGCVSADRSLHC